MNVQITARNFDLTEGIKNAIEDKLTKLHKLVDNSTRIQVVLESATHGKKIEIMFHVKGSFVKSEVKHDDLYVAIDEAVDKLLRTLKRLITKHKYHPHTSLRFEDATDFLPDGDEDNSEETSRITKRKRFNMKPMMEEEAVLQMEMLGHETFMFFNGNTHSMCLLYKRKDGDLGIIESRYQ